MTRSASGTANCASACFFQIFFAVLDGRQRGAEDQILDLHLALGLLVAALDDGARAAALVGIFHLRLHARGAEIKLGADVRGAKLLRHSLVVGHAVLVEDEHDDRALHGVALVLAEKLKAEEETRHADRDAGGRHLLAGEALDKAVIAAAAHHGAQPDLLPALIDNGRGQLCLEHGTGVVLEPAHDGGIDHDTVGGETAGRQEIVHGGDLADALLADRGPFDQGLQVGEGLVAVAAGGFDEADNRLDLLRRELGPLGVVAGLILAALTEKQTHAFDPEPIELVDGTQHGEVFRLVVRGDSRALQHAIENLAAADLHHIVAARNAEGLERVGGEHAQLGIGGDRGGADRVGVELHELAEAARVPASRCATPAPPDSGATAWAGSGSSPPRSGRAAPSGRSAATATARRRP